MLNLDKYSDIPAFIISLEEAEHRRQVLRDTSIPSSWVDNYFRGSYLANKTVIELKKFYDEEQFENLYKRQIMGGEIGCALSHANVATEIANNKIEVALVLEDDIDLDSGQKLYLLKVYNKLQVMSRAGQNFICHLGNDEILVGEVVKLSEGNVSWTNSSIFEIDFKQNPIWTTHAYFINVGAANYLKENKNPVKCIADDWKTLSNHNVNFKVLYCDPIFSQLDDVVSTIGMRNINGAPPKQRLRIFCRKKILELIGIRNLRYLKSKFVQFFDRTTYEKHNG